MAEEGHRWGFLMRRRDFMKLCMAAAAGPGVLAGTASAAAVEPERLILSGNCSPPQMVCFSTPREEKSWTMGWGEPGHHWDWRPFASDTADTGPGVWYTKQRGWTQLHCLA